MALKELTIGKEAAIDQHGIIHSSEIELARVNGFDLSSYVMLRQLNYKPKEVCEILQNGGNSPEEEITNRLSNFDYSYIRTRRRCGYSDIECLIGKFKAYDDNYIGYTSIQQMCDFYGIALSTYYRRKNRGLSIRECLNGEDE